MMHLSAWNTLTAYLKVLGIKTKSPLTTPKVENNYERMSQNNKIKC